MIVITPILISISTIHNPSIFKSIVLISAINILAIVMSAIAISTIVKTPIMISISTIVIAIAIVLISAIAIFTIVITPVSASTVDIGCWRAKVNGVARQFAARKTFPFGGHARSELVFGVPLIRIAIK